MEVQKKLYFLNNISLNKIHSLLTGQTLLLIWCYLGVEQKERERKRESLEVDVCFRAMFVVIRTSKNDQQETDLMISKPPLLNGKHLLIYVTFKGLWEAGH